jgi:hypothetical protein
MHTQWGKFEEEDADIRIESNDFADKWDVGV